MKHPRRQAALLSAALWLSAALLAKGTQAQNTVSAQQIAADASWNELHAADDGHPFRYLIHEVDSGKSTTREDVETRDGDVSRLLASGGRTLTPAAEQEERTRLERLRADPGAMARRQAKAHAESVRENEMLQLLPRAFNFTLLGEVAGPNGPCYRLQFSPNPAFKPPDREGQVYHGMAGELWVDEGQKRIVKLDAHLIADVDFGWGIAGRLFQGGTILVEQRDVGGHHWETTHQALDLHGKILMVKGLSVVQTEDASEFAPVANDGYQAAITYLLGLPAPTP